MRVSSPCARLVADQGMTEAKRLYGTRPVTNACLVGLSLGEGLVTMDKGDHATLSRAKNRAAFLSATESSSPRRPTT
jgi:hypothetical protein